MFDDDDFDNTAKKMIKIAIVGYAIILLILAIGLVGLLYILKSWFFGGF